MNPTLHAHSFDNGSQTSSTPESESSPPATENRSQADEKVEPQDEIDALIASGHLDEAFQRIYMRFWSPLNGFFRRRGLRPEDAQDLAQETLLSVPKICLRFVAKLASRPGSFESPPRPTSSAFARPRPSSARPR